jgi:hypothetical protein
LHKGNNYIQSHLYIMDQIINKRIDEYIVGFKNDIKSKLSSLNMISNTSSEDEQEKIREYMEFIFEYPKLVLEKSEFVTSKKKSATETSNGASLTIPVDMQCIAKRSDGIQCTRKKKKNCEYCGTHAKLELNQVLSTTTTSQRMEVFAEDINGIIYYIDTFNNVYHTEDILEGTENPRIIAKAIRNSDNSFKIPDLG